MQYQQALKNCAAGPKIFFGVTNNVGITPGIKKKEFKEIKNYLETAPFGVQSSVKSYVKDGYRRFD